MPLTLTSLQDIPLIRQGDNLADIVVNALQKNQITLENNDIFVTAQKIVSKTEGRAVNLAMVTPSQRAIELAGQTDKDARIVELILQESNEVLRTRPGAIIVEHKLGFVCANAGIDHSNVADVGDTNEEWVLLLPTEPDRSAEKLRNEIKSITGKQIGILIIDSHGEHGATARSALPSDWRDSPVCKTCAASLIFLDLNCASRKWEWRTNSRRPHPL